MMMREFAGVTVLVVLVVLVGLIAAFTLITVIVAIDAAIVVRYTTFGADENIYANDWDPCDSFQAPTCQ
jgi:hypothetical protein